MTTIHHYSHQAFPFAVPGTSIQLDGEPDADGRRTIGFLCIVAVPMEDNELFVLRGDAEGGVTETGYSIRAKFPDRHWMIDNPCTLYFRGRPYPSREECLHPELRAAMAAAVQYIADERRIPDDE